MHFITVIKNTIYFYTYTLYFCTRT